MASGVSRLARRQGLCGLAQFQGAGPSSSADGRSWPVSSADQAEWEYAARAGTTTARWWGEAIGSDRANCNGCGSRGTTNYWRMWTALHPIPSACTGCWEMPGSGRRIARHDDYKGAPTDGSAWAERNCKRHVIRGGSWDGLRCSCALLAVAGVPQMAENIDPSSLTGFRVPGICPDMAYRKTSLVLRLTIKSITVL